ncbi:ABC transporter permease [Microvirga sp. 17 mud 1-3]|uniref:ABC transporter permease n=1 Tax=Microvirga sp. 17 mud 1-3 TaxID=2082949 RepID=UPI000D6B73F7|nr:ABC transporter permease [Microvirga sp. 17 mud 1-3]AWM88436.1 ABC transporter permease [Microvirga sp. 17 mud 1-3]
MLSFVAKRLLQGALVIVAMSVIVFLGVYAIGDPIDMLVPETATELEIQMARQRLGLDQPLLVQYGRFALQALQGDIGTSFVFNQPTLQLILSKFPATLELAVTAMAVAIIVGLPLGVLAGLKPDSWYGRAIMSISVIGFSLPGFWFGLLLIMVFAVNLGLLPANGRGETVSVFGVELAIFTWDGFKHVILPATNLALFKLALVIRLARAGTREAMLQDYMRFAYAKGMGHWYAVRVHLIPNILIPIITVIGMEFGSVIAFAAVTESIYAWPGMGRLLIESINNLDRPVVVAYLMFAAVLFVVINLIVDILYATLDPRVRFTKSSS